MRPASATVAQQYELAIPRPDALVESLRSMGYSLPGAVADILDNSIAAGACTVWVRFEWNGPDSFVSVIDDGRGMNSEELFEALRPGSQSPLEERSAVDLGRFGLGLKTASFSQGRRLTVVSKKPRSEECAWRWDLDYVEQCKEWRLLRGAAAEDEKSCSEFRDKTSHGTLVIWGNVDRVVDNRPASDSAAHQHFNDLIGQVRDHLAMTLHRFLAGDSGILGHALQIYVNGNRVAPWDPFLEAHQGTYRSPEETVGNGTRAIKVKGFVLPHKDRLTATEFAAAAGPKGWVAQQGFYIYRNDRILVAGDWLRLGRSRPFQKDEHTRLARLSIDISNNQDFDWSLDVKKSTARPPVRVRERLTDLAQNIRDKARQEFFHRGLVGANPRTDHQIPLDRPWISKVRAGRNVYGINREHGVVKNVLGRLGHLKKDAELLLRVIEETVPVERIWLDASEGPGDHAGPYDEMDESVVRRDLEHAFCLLRDAGVTKSVAINHLRSLEPFNRFQALITRLEEN
jgi:hypothetical protein